MSSALLPAVRPRSLTGLGLHLLERPTGPRFARAPFGCASERPDETRGNAATCVEFHYTAWLQPNFSGGVMFSGGPSGPRRNPIPGRQHAKLAAHLCRLQCRGALPLLVHDTYGQARKALGKAAAGAGPVAIVREVFDPR